jgi:hypothetical protein
MKREEKRREKKRGEEKSGETNELEGVPFKYQQHRMTKSLSTDFVKGNGGNWEYGNDYFSISVTGNGNVPKFTFWYTKDPGTKFFLRFQQVRKQLNMKSNTINNKSFLSPTLSSLLLTLNCIVREKYSYSKRCGTVID